MLDVERVSFYRKKKGYAFGRHRCRVEEGRNPMRGFEVEQRKPSADASLRDTNQMPRLYE
jgi:hypothetical protein